MKLRGHILRLQRYIWPAAFMLALVATVLVLTDPDAGSSRAAANHAHAAPLHRTGAVAPRRSRSVILPAQAAVGLAAPTSIPRSFFGISTEYWGFAQYGDQVPLFAHIMSMLHARGTGPMILRIGGDSADHTVWDPQKPLDQLHARTRAVARWEFTLTPSWLQEARWLVEHLHVRLIVDLNLVTGSPLQAAQWARAVEKSLPRGSIAGFEIGNEPDLYSRRFWIETVSPTAVMAAFVPSNLAPLTYNQDFRSYAQALARVAPGVPLVGPAVANSVLDVKWIARLLAAPHPHLGTVSGHWYPYSGCARRRSGSFPTIGRLLSENATAGMARGARRIVRLAHKHGLPFRLTELNSLTCGGRAGVSDTFATALWAPDALFELLRAGVAGINVHLRAHTINAPFTLSRYGLNARPFLYGLLLFSRMLGPRSELLRVQLRAPRTLHLKVWAVRVGAGILRVLLIDKGAYAARVDLRLPASGPASVQRLLGPGPAARSGVTLEGQHLSRSGRWRARGQVQTIAPTRSGYQVTVPKYSAALLSVRIATGRTTTARRSRPPAGASRRAVARVRRARAVRPRRADSRRG